MQRAHSLKAILFADAQSYSRHVHESEGSTLRHMQACFALFREHAQLFDGLLVKTTGDGAMVEFDSALAAVRYAIAIQPKLETLNADLGERRAIHFRIGINLGEVLSEEGDRYGNIVNVAARIEAFAEPGGICVTQAVYDQTRGGIEQQYRLLGVKHLRNIPEPETLYTLNPIDDERGAGDAAHRDAARLCLNLIDEVTVGTANMPHEIPADETLRAALGFLAATPGHSASSSTLYRLLWSDEPTDIAKKKFAALTRQAKRLMHRFHETAFSASAAQLALDGRALDVDLVLLSDALEAGEVDDRLLAPTPLSRRILTGLDDVDPAFAAWASVTRHTWHQRLTKLLEQMLAKFSYDDAATRRAAEALLSLEPTHERACQSLLEVHKRANNAPAAMRVFADFRTRILDEFGLEPSIETQQIIQSLREPHGQRPAGEERRATAQKRPYASDHGLPTILIENFSGLEASGEFRYVLSGFRNELVSALGRFRAFVIKEVDSGLIDYRISANCVQTHSELRLDVTLVEARSNRYIWSESFPMSFKRWLKAQQQIIRRIAASLDIHLSGEGKLARSSGNAPEGAAFDIWLRGEDLLNRWDPDCAQEAEDMFRKIIRDTPDFAPAYCSLASSMNIRHLVFPGTERSAERVQQALELARKAVELDPLETRAQLTLAWSLTMNGEFEQADLHYALARELNPNSQRTLVSCAQGYAFTNQLERASDMEVEALQLAPEIPPFLWAYLACSRYIQGRFEESIDAAEAAGSSIADMPGWRALSHIGLGQKDAAREAVEELVATVARHWVGEEACTPRTVARWFLNSFPVREPGIIEQMAAGLAEAGLATD